MRIAALFIALATPLTAQPDKIFAKDSKWEIVSEGHQFAEGMAFDSNNNFYFTDVPRAQLFRIDAKNGVKTLLDDKTGRANGIAFGPDGHLYGCASGDRKIYAWNPETWKKAALLEGLAGGKGPRSNDIAILKDGTIFFTDPQSKSIWRISADKQSMHRAKQLAWNPNGITVSRDNKTLYVAEFFSGFVHGFAIGDDHGLGEDTIAFDLKTPEDGKGHLDGMFVHHDGRLIIGTKLGIQIATSALPKKLTPKPVVIPIPNNLPRCNYVRISPDGKWLYAAHAKAILRRELDPEFSK